MAELLTAPAHLWVPEHHGTAGPEAAGLADSLGMILDGEQRLALDAIFAEKADGRWAAFECAVIAARQNLKTFLFEVVALADLFLFDARLVIWTAHLFPTTMEAFRDLKRVIDGNDHLRRRIKRISEANGEESIELTSGQRLLFRARSKGGGRGLTGDRVILDEAFNLDPSAMGSLLPTLSARPNPQVLYGSSAGMATSDVLRSVRDRGRSGGDPSLAYVEWCAPVSPCGNDRCDHRPGSPGCALDDVELWGRANPAMGRRISVEHISAERRALPPEEFARERLGWWEEPAGALAGLPINIWEAGTFAGPTGELLALAVDVTPDLAFTSVAKVTEGPVGLVLELAAHRRGTSWAVDEVSALRAETGVPVVLDLGGPASVLCRDFIEADIETVNPSGRDVAQACSALLDGLIRRTVWHADDTVLDSAVRGATRRPLGDAWAWSRKNSLADISPLVAVTLALWGAQSVEPEPEPMVAFR